MIMVHGDDRGLVLPPKVAPTQVIMIPIGPPKTRDAVVGRTDELFRELKSAGIRVRVDDNPDVRPGWKFNEYEMRGVPVRLEIGPRDMENGVCVLVSRITGEKKVVEQANLIQEVQSMLEQVHQEMFDRAKQFREDHFYSVETLDEMKDSMEDKRGFGRMVRFGLRDTVKQKTGATSRNIPFEPAEHKTKCLVCGEDAKHTVLFASVLEFDIMTFRLAWRRAIARPHRGFIIWSKLPDGEYDGRSHSGAGRWSAASGSFIFYPLNAVCLLWMYVDRSFLIAYVMQGREPWARLKIKGSDLNC